MPTKLARKLREFYWRRKYRAGIVVTRFLAPDIRRDVEVVDSAEISSGVILGKVRTWNVLYASRGIREKPVFSETRRLDLEHLWDWSGEAWGGPVPESEESES